MAANMAPRKLEALETSNRTGTVWNGLEQIAGKRQLNLVQCLCPPCAHAEEVDVWKPGLAGIRSQSLHATASQESSRPGAARSRGPSLGRDL